MSVHVRLVGSSETVLVRNGTGFETDEGELLIYSDDRRDDGRDEAVQEAIFACGQWVSAMVTRDARDISVDDEDGEE